MSNTIPLSLYLHFPWCVKKCPYCDFNSHALKTEIPQALYIEALLKDLDEMLPAIWGRRIISIFMGGGTPSLFSEESIDTLLSQLRARLNFGPETEITLEANPGTVEHSRFLGYRQAGVNRISLGVQSFSDEALKILGRIHDGSEAQKAIEALKKAGFDDFNLDLMYALPNQTPEAALKDLHTALSFEPPHLSWYELTLEPNTPFYHRPPPVPTHDVAVDIEEQGLSYLAEKGWKRYEISAFQHKKPCYHNINYWTFGDYLGLGAGAHSKLTNPNTKEVIRQIRHKHPKDYLDAAKPFIAQTHSVSQDDLSFEYMLNTLRLIEPLPITLFTERTGLPVSHIMPILKQAEQKGWVNLAHYQVQTTDLGKRFLNDLTALFLY